jgi:hypothetical protein
VFNPLNAELNPICHLLALLGGATIVVLSRLRVKNVQLAEIALYNLRHYGSLKFVTFRPEVYSTTDRSGDKRTKGRRIINW